MCTLFQNPACGATKKANIMNNISYCYTRGVTEVHGYQKLLAGSFPFIVQPGCTGLCCPHVSTYLHGDILGVWSGSVPPYTTRVHWGLLPTCTRVGMTGSFPIYCTANVYWLYCLHVPTKLHGGICGCGLAVSTSLYNQGALGSPANMCHGVGFGFRARSIQ